VGGAQRAVNCAAIVPAVPGAVASVAIALSHGVREAISSVATLVLVRNV
jgi:hypothetical protein